MSVTDNPIFQDKWDRPPLFQLAEQPLAPAGVVMTVHGELDIATAPEFRERLDAAIDGGAKRLVLDLSPVTFLDSVAMATILHARTRLGDDGRLALVIPKGSYTLLIFEVAGLPRCLDVFETLEETIAHVGG